MESVGIAGKRLPAVRIQSKSEKPMSDDKVTNSTEPTENLTEKDLEQASGGALPEKELSVSGGCATGNYLKKILQD
jgi:hypothetical protein